jgi:predicted transcriptional regulator
MLKRTTIWISEDTLAKLKKIAKKQERPIGWLLRKAAEEFVTKNDQQKES